MNTLKMRQADLERALDKAAGPEWYCGLALKSIALSLTEISEKLSEISAKMK